MYLKGYDRKKFSQRYREYRQCFVVQALIFVVFLSLGALVWNKVSLSSFGEELIRLRLSDNFGASPSFVRVLKAFESYGFALVVLFASGITLYAPFAVFCVGAYLGLSQGIILGAYFRLVSEGAEIWKMLWDCFFSFSSAAFVFMYGAFCLCVAFKQMGVIPDTDQKIFSGSLFCSSFYKNIINLRFLLFYIGIFIAFEFAQGLFSWAYLAVMGCL